MPSLYALKPAFQRLLQPVCSALLRAGVTPDQVTGATLLAGLAMGCWLYAGRTGPLPALALPLFLFLRMAANALDGMIARQGGRVTVRGAVLNEAGDVLADLALYLPFAAMAGIRPGLAVSAVALAVLVEGAGLLPLRRGGARRHDGPMGKSDRAFAYGALGLLHGLGVRSARFWDAAFVALIALLLWTAANRIRRGRAA